MRISTDWRPWLLMGLVTCISLPGVANANLGDGLVAFYPLDGDATDASGNGNHGTISGALPTADRCGVDGAAYAFDGQDDQITVPSSSSLDVTGAITIAAWVRPIEKKAQTIVRKGGGIPAPYRLDLSGTGLIVFSVTAAGQSPIVSSDYEVGTWTLLVGTWDGSSLTLYVNGGITDTAPLSGSLLTSGSSLLLGSRLQLPSSTLNGDLDDVRIWSRALTEDEVRELMRSQVASYPFAGNADDASGHGNHGSVSGAVPTADRFGNPASAYAFDGQDDRIEVPDAPDLDVVSGLTLSAWVRPLEERTQEIVRKGNVVATPYRLGLAGNGDVVFGLYLGGTPVLAVATGYPVGEWAHYAGTWDCTTMTLYLNGEPIATTPASGHLTPNDEPLLIGTRLGLPVDTLFGDIDEVTVWNGALSEEEVVDLMGDPPSPVETVSWGEIKARF